MSRSRVRLRRMLAVASLTLLVLGSGAVAALAIASANPPPGVLAVTTTPDVEAQIPVGDLDRSTRGLVGLDLLAGAHQLRVLAPEGYLPAPCQVVEVVGGRATHVEVELTPAAHLEVVTQPTGLGATIVVDGIERDVDEVRLPVAAGRREVCYAPVAGRITPPCETVCTWPGRTTSVTGVFGPDADASPDRAGAAAGAPAVVRPSGFMDVDAGNAHAGAIACAQQRGLVPGVTADRFEPDRTLTRAQAASMLWRMLEASSPHAADAERVTFDDLDTSVHRDAIEQLAGVVSGGGDGSFDPGSPVRRDQLASMIVGALDLVGDVEVEPGPNFLDVNPGCVHAPSVRRLAALEIARGDGQERFAPGDPVRRAQMASFLVRTADQLLVRGTATTSQPG